jgi:hypothetical protein
MEEPSVEIVPAGASVVGGEITKPSLGGMTPEILKQMGIDISISKEDLLSVITQALSDQAEERIKKTQVRLRGHMELISEKRTKYFEAAVKRVGRKAKVKALAKALGTYYEQAYTIRLEPNNSGAKIVLEPTFTDPEEEKPEGEDENESGFLHAPLFVPDSFKWSTPEQREAQKHRRYQRGDYDDVNLPKIKLNDTVKRWETPEDLRLVKRELEKEVQEATQDQQTLKHDTKRAHTRVIKDLLMQTQHGGTLLQMLDKRTITARVKGSLAADRQEHTEAWEKKEFKRIHGTTHFDDGQDDQVSCGQPRRKKIKVSKDTSAVNCGNCELTRAYSTAYHNQERARAKAAAKASMEARKKQPKKPGKLSKNQPK